MSRPQGPTFKVKHRSGRVLGPLDLDRLKKLIERGEITGEEIAKTYPEEIWKDINLFPEIAALLLAQARGTINNTNTMSSNQSSYRPILGGDTKAMMAPTVVLTQPEVEKATEILKTEEPAGVENKNEEVSKTAVGKPEDEDKTVFAATEEEHEKTQIGSSPKKENFDYGTAPSIQLATSFYEAKKTAGGEPASFEGVESKNQPLPYALTVEKTVAIQRPEELPKHEKKVFRNLTKREVLRVVLLAGLLGYFGYESFLSDEGEKKNPFSQAAVFKPVLPNMDARSTNPKLSEAFYAEGMKFYDLDHVTGYRLAAQKFVAAVQADPGNIKAVAMLASSYINLFDTSNKDETFFAIINRLLDIVRTKGLDLTESIVAEVEYLVEMSRPDSAVERIVDYTRSHPQFDQLMFYYIAFAHYIKGDEQTAAKYIAQYPDNKAFSARIFYLRALIAEKLGDRSAAKQELLKAIKLNPEHMHSRLMLVSYSIQEGRTQEIGQEVKKITDRGALLPPKELARAYFYFGQYFSVSKKMDEAFECLERAIKLDRGNHDYVLEYYTLKAASGVKDEAAKKEALMFVYLREGEKKLKLGLYHEALSQFLQARDASPGSVFPYVKIGDMFWNLHDVLNARLNYEKAAEKAQNSIEIWSRYIRTLIESFEWDAAQKAMDRFRQLPVSQSAIDKAAGDIYAKQERYVEASAFYRKAMSRESIDPDVYLAYGKILMATKQYKDAPLFFSLARRLDPLNTESVILTAKAIANSESVEGGIKVLQAELRKGDFTKAEILTSIAELYLQKGEYEIAQNYIDQARSVNPDLALPWKVQAQIHLNREHVDKKAIDKALDAYKSYSDRNQSDPSGYIERFNLYRKKLEYDKATEELNRIFNIYPKYPNLHYFKGIMYEEMGNRKAAAEEQASELKNNPNSVTAMVALGRVLLESGNAKDSLAPLQKAMELAPLDPQAKYWAALTNHKLKNYSGAVALFRSAAAIDSGNPLIYKKMGECYREMGDQDNARAAFRKYLDMEPDAQDRAEIERYL